MAEVGGQVAGGLVAYRIGDAGQPLDELPPMFRPLQALENRALGTHYVNVLATYPAFRRHGSWRPVGRLLGPALIGLAHAFEQATRHRRPPRLIPHVGRSD